MPEFSANDFAAIKSKRDELRLKMHFQDQDDGHAHEFHTQTGRCVWCNMLELGQPQVGVS